MNADSRSRGRRGVYYTAATACLLLVAGLVLLTLGASGSDSSLAGGPHPRSGEPQVAPPAGRSSTERATTPPRSLPAAADLAAAAAPTALTIPRLGVRARTIESLGLAPNGEIQVPRDADNPGWYTRGPAPGQFGPAVIAGHLDDEAGPAVFYRLSELRAGDRVRVTPRQGPVTVFVVDRVVSFDKRAFPTKAVYGPTRRPELRLITCGGRYDADEGYVRNTVVFAHLA